MTKLRPDHLNWERSSGLGEADSEPGGNRTHNPQLKSRISISKNVRIPSDFSGEVCKSRRCAAKRRNPDAIGVEVYSRMTALASGSSAARCCRWFLLG
jgi:hypothetical protein